MYYYYDIILMLFLYPAELQQQNNHERLVKPLVLLFTPSQVPMVMILQSTGTKMTQLSFNGLCQIVSVGKTVEKQQSFSYAEIYS